MTLLQKAKMRAALMALRAVTTDPEAHAAVKTLAQTDGRLVAEELTETVIRTAGSAEAEAIVLRGIESYMESRMQTLRRDGVHENEINAYGLAYMVAVMERMTEIGAEIDRKANRTPSGLPAVPGPC